MEMVIASARDVGDVRIFELRAADGAGLPGYAAGAHVDVHLPGDIVRQYSLCCSSPSGDAWRIAVRRDPQSRGGSAWLHDVAAPGIRLQVGAPRNAFALLPGAGLYLLYAGGIGITPILSMAYALLARGAAFRLVYFARAEAVLAFGDELLSGPLAPHVEIHAGLDHAAVADRIGASMGAAPSVGTQVYVCGPGRFMDVVREHGASRFGGAAVHQESFGAPAVPVDGDTPFVLRLARSRRDIAVPAGESALACLQAAGIEIDCSCEVGVCGTCRTVVLAGQPDHRDSVLGAHERAANNVFMPCVSRAGSEVLVVDL